jgi:F-type H+-transporting ATPase subunit epsilon
MTQKLPSSFRLKVIAPRKLLVDEEVQELSLPSLDGYLGILPGHRPLFLALGTGRITYLVAEKEEILSVQGGYAEVLPEKVLVFTELSEDENEKPVEGRG